ncbi:lytic polysaccharide monooxygenase [Streptomyces sp. ACA25]|uniref:lytic polysaccharide monooxygenase n=1 Tax=Streptomyces sp. ACA25 TaxID=3022596 RepID=UPI002307066C|nr:lytic polysaccharide monooxygenase [Streptomyces sp. ACA25]MDB1087597.1 lytic polysaccharide monooxygenase [Streptomyces sp. ACA25]
MSLRRLLSTSLAFVMAIPLALVMTTATTASAHGWITSPPSRQDHCATGRVTGCGGLQYEPQSVEAPKGSRQCSGGSGFTVLDDESKNWPVTQVGNSVTLQWRLTAAHSTSTWQYYVDGVLFRTFDQGNTRPPSDISHTLTHLPQGRHTILAVWNIADTPMAFYACVDVNVTSGGGGGTPPPPPPPVAPPECASSDPWDATRAYLGGDTVTYNGHAYRAAWWVRGERPDTSSVWRDLGRC